MGQHWLVGEEQEVVEHWSETESQEMVHQGPLIIIGKRMILWYNSFQT